MTKIVYEPDRLRLRMEGHAGAGAEGEDLVCAALSMLGMTLERRVTELAEHGFPVVTLTEDLELTALAVAGSGRVVYAHDAVTYDEYPTTVRMAARQLSRWCFGQAECMRGYAHRLFGSFFRRGYLQPGGICL